MYKDPLPCITILYNRFFTNKLENHVLDLLQLQFIDNYRSLDTYTMVWTGIFSCVIFLFPLFFFTREGLYTSFNWKEKEYLREKRKKEKGEKGEKGPGFPTFIILHI